jgi:hypothetical protein
VARVHVRYENAFPVMAWGPWVLTVRRLAGLLA